jgi:hypothetical protein
VKLIPITCFADIGVNAMKVMNQNLEKENIFVKLLRLDVSFNKRVSNSHSAPQNKPSNFSREDNKPTSYPGWYGRIWYILSKEPKGFSSNSLNETYLHSGTGGYGLYNLPDYTKEDKDYPLSYDVKIFLDDFPEIKTMELLTPSDIFDGRLLFHFTHKELSDLEELL